jgi:hypothetical protein
MAEREADRIRPDLLRRQAIAALLLDAGREISPEFNRRLREHDAAPTLFGAKDLAAVARTGLETDIARNIDFGQSADSTAAVRDALRQRSDAYVREQRCQLIAERHPNATIVSESVKKACDDGALDAAALILAGRPFPEANNHVRLTEDLLVQASGGGGQ